MNQPVSSLDLPPYLIKKLETTGFYYCDDVTNNYDSLSPKINISNWSSITQALKPKTALELYEEELRFHNVQTFIPELDSILSPMVHSGTVTEFCGLPGSGKTQVCLHLAVGMKGEVVFIHTNKNLSADRLKELCLKFKSHDVMEKMFCIEATDSVELLASIELLANWLNDHYIKLLIIDSISWPIKQLPVTSRTSFLYTLFQKLRILANQHSFGIIVTNDMTTRITGETNQTVPSLGSSFYHLINNRILLSKNGDVFSAEVLKGVDGYKKTIFFNI